MGSSMWTELYLEKNIDRTVLAIIVRALDVCTNSTKGIKASYGKKKTFLYRTRIYLCCKTCKFVCDQNEFNFDTL